MRQDTLVRELRKEQKYSDVPLKYLETASIDGAPEELVRGRIEQAFMQDGSIMDYRLWKRRIGMSVSYSGEIVMEHARKYREEIE